MAKNRTSARKSYGIRLSGGRSIWVFAANAPQPVPVSVLGFVRKIAIDLTGCFRLAGGRHLGVKERLKSSFEGIANNRLAR
jgi:hypothetical protein